MGSTDSLRIEAAQFFNQATGDFDMNKALYWSFIFEGAKLGAAEAVSDQLRNMGFEEVDVEPIHNIDVDDLDDLERFMNFPASIFVREHCRHTEQSFVDRVLECQRFSDHNGLKMADFSVGIE